MSAPDELEPLRNFAVGATVDLTILVAIVTVAGAIVMWMS
jgi:hypothetical protein